MPKTILITGSTDGIGLETAKALYSQGHHVLLHGRSDKKMKAGEKALAKPSSDGRVESYLADLSRMADVEMLGEAIAANHEQINPMTLIAAILSALLFVPAAASEDTLVDLPLRDREKCFVPGAEELRARFGGSKHTAEQQELMELEWRACQMFGDASTVDHAIDAIVADHGIVLRMGAGIAHGKEIQKKMFKQYFDAGYDIVWEPVHAETSGDIAWVIGLIAETKPDGSINFGKYVSTWKKMDGKWTNTLEMRNSNGGVPVTN